MNRTVLLQDRNVGGVMVCGTWLLQTESVYQTT